MPANGLQKKVLSSGNFNGCVEASRLFMELLREIDPEIECKYVSSFELDWANTAAKTKIWENPRGHAIVEVKDSKDSSLFLIDTSMFINLFTEIKEEDIMQICSINQKWHGKVIQPITKNVDIHIEKKDSKYFVTYYEYGHVFNETKKVGNPYVFSAIKEVNNHLRQVIFNVLSFQNLEKALIVKREDEGGSFMRDRKKYIIFEKKLECPYITQFCPNGSDEATIKAAQKYMDAK